MRRRLRALAWVFAIGGATVALVYIVLALVLTVGDNDKYGKVAVPGEGLVSLPAESVVIHYEARANLSENDTIDVPGDLEVRLNPPLEFEDGSHISAYQLGDTAGTSVWRVDVSEERDYGVVTSVGPGAPYPDKAITFGPDAEMGKVLLRGAAMIVIGLAIGGVLLAWSRRYRRPPATLTGRA